MSCTVTAETVTGNPERLRLLPSTTPVQVRGTLLGTTRAVPEHVAIRGRFDERPVPAFAAIEAPAGARALVAKSGEVLAVFFRAGYSMFDARDVQKARTADLAVVSCETGRGLYHFRSKKRREVGL